MRRLVAGIGAVWVAGVARVELIAPSVRLHSEMLPTTREFASSQKRRPQTQQPLLRPEFSRHSSQPYQRFDVIRLREQIEQMHFRNLVTVPWRVLRLLP